MNIVIVKHFGDLQHYMFCVPENKKLRQGDMVLVSNRRGVVGAECCCDSFHLDESPLKLIMNKFGAKTLQPVIGIFEVKRWDEEG